MVENRPDWCISRQRLWGVPITIFYCNECQHELLTKEILDHIVEQLLPQPDGSYSVCVYSCIGNAGTHVHAKTN
jgi:isoleucyl-tRNA synthetase